MEPTGKVQPTKHAFDSLTLRGIVVIIFGALLNWFGIGDISDEGVATFVDRCLDVLPELIQLGGIIAATIGRVRAKSTIYGFNLWSVFGVLLWLGLFAWCFAEVKVHAAESYLPQAASFRIWAGNSGGSGTAISEHLVVTNAHVVGTQYEGIRVVQPLTGREHAGRVLATSQAADVALVFVPDATLPCVPVSREGPSIGMQTHMIGYGGDNVMKIGTGRFIAADGFRADGVRVWDASVQSVSGDSGGGLFDDRGQLVAINWGSKQGSHCSASTSSAEIIKVVEEYSARFKIDPAQCFGQSWGQCRPSQQPSYNGPRGELPPKQPVSPFTVPDVPHPDPPEAPPVAQQPTVEPLDYDRLAEIVVQQLADDIRGGKYPNLKGPAGPGGATPTIDVDQIVKQLPPVVLSIDGKQQAVPLGQPLRLKNQQRKVR